MPSDCVFVIKLQTMSRFGLLNMNCHFIFVIFSIIDITSPKQKETTLNVHERVRILKYKIAEEIKQNQRAYVTPVVHDFPEEYVDIDSQPVTPIMSFDDRKKNNKFKLRQLKTTAKVEQIVPDLRIQKKPPKKVRNKKERNHQRKRKLKSDAIDIFYRRGLDLEMMKEPLDWTHCQDLITPYLTGQKIDIKKPKRITVKDPVVLRLIQLLTVNTTGQSKDDIYSVMYQISNLQLRLFQWDVVSIKFLLTKLITDKKHSFAGLKHGLKAIFASWNLDITNTTNLLKQARIFRPPCVRITDYGGSTKTSRTLRYTKTVKKKCLDYDDDECRDP